MNTIHKKINNIIFCGRHILMLKVILIIFAVTLVTHGETAHALFLERGVATTAQATSSFSFDELKPDRLFQKVRESLSTDIFGVNVSLVPSDLKNQIGSTISNANDKLRETAGIDIIKFSNFVLDQIMNLAQVITGLFKG